MNNKNRNWVAFGNNELEKLPDMKKGDVIICSHCGKKHKVKAFKDKDGNDTNMFAYECGEKLYLAGVDGKNILGVKGK